ncbi:STAS domain-containing protein [Kitasatospora sp. NPDC048365]|uniref:STAS domain-containing protein n=1 Tax=Kitasatospora sp. NPDC048365 TaxID=3364050 RepID=UPI00371320C4
MDSMVIVRLEGGIHHENCRRLELELARALEHRPRRLVVDLSRLDFCDTAGLNSLLRIQESARADTRLVLAAPSRPVQGLLDITGTDTVFTISPSVRAALTAADPSGHTRDELPS